MQIYINKNNQQLGPFDEAKVFQMLQNGQLAPQDLAIRQGATQWQPLANLFPNANSYRVNPPTVNTMPPPKKGSGLKILLGVLLGLGVLVILGAGGIFYAVRFGQNRKEIISEDYKTNAANADNANTANTKNPAYYKAFAEKSVELSNLKPTLKPDKSAKVKGKVTIIEKTQGNFDYKMLGFDVRGNENLQQYISQDEDDVKNYNLTFKDLAENLDELDTLIKVDCNKGKVIGRYEYGITAYSNRCLVSVIDYKAKTIVAQKTFENSKPQEEIKVRKDQLEEILLYPYEDIQNYIKQFPK
jgi:hypothetical protein